MLSRRGIILCFLSILLGIYLLIAIPASRSMAASAPCPKVVISVAQNDMSPFVTAEDINHELNNIVAATDSLPASQFDLRAMEQQLSALSFIESANCMRLANDNIAIDVVPMVPIARVFSPYASYYINKDGKHLTASTRYQIDVPIIVTDTLTSRKPDEILPLISQLKENPDWDKLVSYFKIDRSGDIIIVPQIAGHIIVIGSPDNFPDKMSRIFDFYRQILPVKGWNYYDTLSVKFSGQVIANIAPGMKKTYINPYSDEDLEDLHDETGIFNDSIVKPKIK